MTELLDDRLPPQNIEAEQAVLGAVFLEPSALTLASEILMPEDFYRMSHQKIYKTMILGDRGEAIDVVTVTSELANKDSRRGRRDFVFNRSCRLSTNCSEHCALC